ncbi:MAG TPA: hypothetical protein VF719_13855, partial [Abditibacteriaceae bacterium]
MKTKYTSVLTMAFCAATAFAALSPAVLAADAGVVAIAQNDVKMQLPGGKARRAGAMQSLPENTRVQVGAGSRAVVVIYKDGSRYSLAAGSTATVSEDGLKVVSGPPATRLPNLNMRQAKILQSSRVAYGRSASTVVRGNAKPELMTLTGGTTLDARPTFMWAAFPKATAYKVRLFDANDKQIWEHDVTGTSITYPAEAPALRPGVDYLWTLSTVVDGEVKKTDGGFRILTDAQKQELQVELDAIKE